MKKQTKAVNLRLTQEEIDLIKKIGGGCLTAGIRILLGLVKKG